MNNTLLQLNQTPVETTGIPLYKSRMDSHDPDSYRHATLLVQSKLSKDFGLNIGNLFLMNVN